MSAKTATDYRDTIERRGINIGMAMAAAILTRDFGQPTLALEILGAAGIGSFEVEALDLDDYDRNPLRAIVAQFEITT